MNVDSPEFSFNTIAEISRISVVVFLHIDNTYGVDLEVFNLNRLAVLNLYFDRIVKCSGTYFFALFILLKIKNQQSQCVIAGSGTVI